MSATGILTTEPGRGAEEIDWRHVWLTSVMVDSGELRSPKIGRYTVQTRKDSLTRRLHRLRRMRAVLGPSR
jgi:hypothetical protein